MASESVAIAPDPAPAARGSKHDLWISGGDAVLTVTIDKDCPHFPPEAEQCGHLSNAIQGLARAAKAVVFHAEHDANIDSLFAMQPIEDIADAIILLSQLSDAIRSEASVEGAHPGKAVQS